jgi:plastocyanin
MKRLIAVLAAVAVAGAALMAIPAFGATRSVALRDNVFSPRTITIKRGDTIRFVWRGRNPHNITTTRRPRGASRVTAPAKRKGTYRKRFTTRGTYRLLCTIHQPSMRMTVRVR